MVKLAETSVPILEGQALLVRLPKSPKWHVKYKAENRWVRTSTKKKNLEEAKKRAVEIVLDAMHREKFGLPVINRSFKSVALLAIDRMKKEKEAARAKVVFDDYIQALENYFIPFFGQHHITTIDHKMLDDFDNWRIDKLGRQPAASTITTHNSALYRVFDEAVFRGYMNNSQIPLLRNDGTKGERRPTFTLQEYRQLYRFMRKWVRMPAKNQNATDMRYLLRDKVLLLAATGMRYGTESYGLKWNHIRVDGKYVMMSVDGKTGRRDLMLRNGALKYLQRIWKRTNDIKDIPFDQVLTLDKLVFRLPNGTATQSLHQNFRKMLTAAKLLKDPITGQNRTLYSLRHFYITMALIYKRTDQHTLCKQCGTSVLMLQKHYSHLHVWDKREELSR